MLQIDTKPFASDALEDAMRLAQTKSLNSFTFSDCFNYLNYAWSDIYNRMAQIDAGYYSKAVKLDKQLTVLPPYVKNTILVYSAQRPLGFNREIFRLSGNADMQASGTYHISGQELYCPDATRKSVWVEYVPACPLLFFTLHNRDPKIYDEPVTAVRSVDYNLYTLKCFDAADTELDITDTDTDLSTATKWTLKHKNSAISVELDITDYIMQAADDELGQWQICYVSCAYPYIFVTYKHSITGKYMSGFFDSNFSWTGYNPFDFTGKGSNVEYVTVSWNDKTGMGVIINDYNDMKTVDDELVPTVKELGWTPDTVINYPLPEMYRYLVARLADKFSALNESNIMGVQKELTEAQYAFEACFEKNKAAWKRINNVNPANLTDWLV